MTDKDFLLSSTDFPDNEDPFAIKDMKKATFRQLREVQVVNDYVFCSLLQSSRLAYLEQSALNPLKNQEE
jgi:hypothetical protein